MLEAAVQMARKGGANAVVLREVTRQAGVAPNAAYRHFSDRNALLQAVSLAAQAALAVEIEEEINKIPKTNNSIEAARSRLRAVGIGYLRFSQAEPGLFGMAFSVPHDLSDAENPASAGKAGLTPFQHLGVALDMLVEAGALTQERRLFAEIFAWSAVHGFAMLVLEGPLRALDKSQTEVIGQRLIDMVERGL
ncbi:MAG TPA: TetR/AcrR family transcriptional regulator, partial [Methylotenera sp.]|nr:TetR/AcrR family transcriptional regulator [Methylotenera sp.]